MCQPGLPSPQGLGHAGSPALLAFQRAKSIGLFFSPWSVVLSSPAAHIYTQIERERQRERGIEREGEGEGEREGERVGKRGRERGTERGRERGTEGGRE